MMENFGESNTVDVARGADSAESDFSAPGLIVAAIWAIGLIVGLSSIATGHLPVAISALVVAVIAPWIGLAWVRHDATRRDDDAELPFVGAQYGLSFTAR